jgi:hypothetical protein
MRIHFAITLLILLAAMPAAAQREAKTSSARAAYSVPQARANVKSKKKKKKDKNRKAQNARKGRRNNVDEARERRRSLSF